MQILFFILSILYILSKFRASAASFRLRAIFTLLCLTLPLPAADLARLPYEMVYHAQLKSVRLVQTYTNLFIYFRLRSTLPNVKISDLDLYIDSKDGHIPVLLDSDGRFTVPMRDNLLAEKTAIVVNQPKGTMEFGWYVGLVNKNPPTNGVRYNTLMRPLKDLEDIRAEMLPGAAAPPARGLKFIYPKDKVATVVIHANSGDRSLRTDSTHAIVIPWAPSLGQENPLLGIPIPPEKVDVADETAK